MKTKKRKMKLLNRRGSAMVMALIVMTALVLLGVAVAALSMSTLRNNATDAGNNDAFYAAEAGVNCAIDQIKFEASMYYLDMLDAQPAEYDTLYDNFFANINNNAQTNFAEPALENVVTQTTFSAGSFDSENSTCEFLISCNAVAGDGMTYQVTGSVLVKKVDVSGGTPTWFKVDNAAIKAGGTLALGKKNGVGANGGNIIVADLTHERK